MSRSVDSRIVEMKFENGKFKNDIKDTIESLDRLKKESDFSKLQDSAKKINFSNITNEVEKVGTSFKALDALKFSIFNNIGTDIYNSFKNGLEKIPSLISNVFNLMKSKGWSRAANLENARFQLDNLKIGWENVEQQIDAAVSGTAFGLDSAARAASQLASTGVKIKDNFKFSKVVNGDVDAMERALGAISGIAAMTGRQYDDIASVFVDTAAAGKASADTFTRLSQRGLNATATLAKAMNITEADVKKLAKQGKISFQDFADAMYDAFYESAKKSNDSFDGALANMQFALGKIGAEFATPIRKGMIEPFNEVRQAINRVKEEMKNSGLFEYFSKLTQVGSKLVSNFVSAFRQNDKNFEWVGNLTQAFKNLVDVIINVVIPIKDAFKSVFGDSIINSVNELTNTFAKFIAKLKPTGETMAYIRIGFEGFFQILKSIGRIIGQVITGLTGLNVEGTSLLGWVGRGIAIGLKVLGILSEFIVDVINIKGILETVSRVLNIFVKGITTVVSAIGIGFAFAFANAYDAVSNFISLITSKVGQPSSNPLVILVREVVARIKEIPTIFPKAVTNIKEFFKSFNTASSVNDKFKLLFSTLSKLKTRIGDVLKNIAKSIRNLGSDNMLTRFIASVVSGIGTVIQNVGDFALIVSSVIVAGLGKASDSIKNFFSVFTQNMSRFNGNALVAFWRTFTDGLKNFISNIPGAVNGIKQFFSELEILDRIKDKFSTFTSWISDCIKKIKDVFSTLGVVDVYAADFNKSVDSITGASSKSKWDTSGIQAFIHKLKEFVTNGGLVKVAILGINGALIAVMIQFARFLGSATGLTNGLTKIVNSVKKVTGVVGDKGLVGSFKNLTSGLKDFVEGAKNGSRAVPKLDAISTAVIKLTASVGILVGALMALTMFMEKHDITGAGSAMAKLAAGILVFTTALGVLNKVCKLDFLFRFSKAMLLMAASMAILVKAMNDIDTGDGLAARFGALAGLMGTLVGVSFLLNKAAPKLWKGSLSLLAFAAVIKVFTKVLDLIPNITLSLKDFFTFGATIFLMAVFLENGFNQFSKAIANMAALCLSIAASAAILAGVVMMLGNYEGNIAKGIATVTALVAIVSLFGVLVAVATKKFGGRLPKFNASLLMVAGAVAILAKVATALGEVDGGQLAKGVVAISTFLVLIGLLMAASALTEKAHPVKFAASLVLITGCIALLSGLAAIIGLIPNDILMKGVALIGGLLLLVGALIAVSALTAKANTGAIIASIIAISVIMGELVLLSSIKDWGGIKSALGFMTVIVVEFGVLMALISKGKYNSATVGVLLSSVIAVTALAGALYLLATKVTDWKSLIAPTIAIGAVLGIYANMLNQLGKRYFEPASLKVLLVGALVLGEVGLALVALTSVGDWASILASVFAINRVITNLFNVMELLTQEKIDIKQVANFALACLSLVPVALALSQLASNDWGSILASTGAMVATIWSMSNALTVLATWDFVSLAGAAVSLVAVAGAIRILASAFAAMTEVQWPTVALACATLGIMTAALMLLSSVSAPALIAAGAILVVSAAIGIIALSMLTGAIALERFVPQLQLLATLDLAALGGGLLALSGGLSAFALTGVALVVGAPGLALAALYMSPLAKGLQEMAKVKDISHIPGPLALIGAAGLTLGLAAPGMALAGAAFTTLSAGITVLGTAVSRAATLISAGINTIVTTLRVGAANIKTSGEQIGVNVGAGMINGISSSLPKVVKAGASLAKGVFESIKTTLGIHSPSTQTTWAGKMTGQGFENGVTSQSIWSSIKSKVSSLLNSSVLAPLSGAITKLKGAFSNLKATVSEGNWVDKLPASVKNLATKAKDAVYETTGLDNIFKDLKLDTDSTTGAFGDMANGADDLSAALDGGDGKGGAAKSAEKTKDAFTELKDKISEQMDIFSEFERKTELSSEKLLENMQDQINGVAEWSKMMGDLAMRGINQGLLQKLADLGPKGYEYVHAFVTMTDDQLSQANALYAKSLIIPEASASVITNSFNHAGLWATQGFVNGLDMEKFRNSGVEGAEAVRDGLEGAQGLQIHSPSRVMYENGRYAIAGFVKGVDNQNKTSLEPKMISVAKGVVSTLKSEASSDKFREIGANVVRGLIDGMASKEGDLRAKAESIANSISSRISSALQIHSPSRVMRKLGGYTSEGLALGIEDNQNMVTQAVDTIANTAVSGLRDAISLISNNSDLDMDFNPTITPVLDLSNIEAGTAEINKITSSWNNMSIGVSSNLASKSQADFNNAMAAKANIAYDSQNGIDMLRSAIKSLQSNETVGMTQNNTFNITGDDPRAIADEVSKVLQMQVERRGAVWA